MRRLLGIVFALAFVLGGCGDPPQKLPPEFHLGSFANNGELHFMSLHIEQDEGKVKGRYAWDWSSVFLEPVYGDFTGTVSGNEVNLKLIVPEDIAKKINIPELDLVLNYVEASPGDAAGIKDLVSKLPIDDKDRPKDLDTRKMMKLAGSLNYKLGDRERMAVGFIPDINVNEFKDDKG